MSLTKTISAIFTTIGIAIPSALTTWVLTKPKPLKEIDKTIELDEYEEEIDEKEIKPQEAPPSVVPPTIPPFPPRVPLQPIPDTDQELQEPPSGEEEQSPSQNSQQEQNSVIEEPEAETPLPDKPEQQPDEEEKEEEPDPEKTDDEQEAKDEKEEDVEEIKKSLVEAIGVIVQKYKDGYRIETGSIYDSFDMKQKLEYLVKSIKFLEQDKKDKEEAAKAGQKESGSVGESSKGVDP